MSVKENEKEIGALQKQIAELEAKLAETEKSKPTMGKPNLLRRRSLEQAKKEIKAQHSKKAKTYRATRAGTDHKEGFIAEGRTFSTTQPKGDWMEEVETKEAEADKADA